MKDIALLKENAKNYFALLEFEEKAQEFLLVSLDRIYANRGLVKHRIG